MVPSPQVSWCEDYEQDYEELSCLAITKMSFTATDDPSFFNDRTNSVQVYFNPHFVSDILCPDGTTPGKLATIFTEESEQRQCYFLAKNTKYVVGIDYPDVIIPTGVKTLKEDSESNLFAKKKPSFSFANRIASEKLHFLDGFRQDSLVTKSLLDMTSYAQMNEVQQSTEPPDFDLDQEDPISFDDLGKIYKSISRSRILNNVQCPNVHFHAHPDGSTTIHQHKSCPNPSLATLDPRRKTSSDSKAKVISLDFFEKKIYSAQCGIFQNSPRGKDNSYEVVSDLVNHDEEVYSSLNDESSVDNGHHSKRSPQSMLGPLPVPPKALKSKCECSTKDPVCDMEGGIKFNPCYMSKPDLSHELCDVMLDAVWQAGHAAAVHAGRTKCMHCAHFTSKFNAEMKDIMQSSHHHPGNGGSKSKRVS